VNAGLAYDEVARERAFDERFRKILLAAAPDRDRPLVFYCTGAQCWASANAAMRARQAGYTQVLWYRGGQAAWQAAGLPVTPRAPVALVY
jgi:rhodanese-related sulfurtransferase